MEPIFKTHIELAKYNKSEMTDSALFHHKDKELKLDSIKLKASHSEKTAGESCRSECSFTALNGGNNVGVNVVFSFDNWSENNYVFAPAALYNGNRFICAPKEYPPMLTKEENKEYGLQTVISDVPKLNINKGETSKVQLSVGDMATPCVGFLMEEEEKAFFLLFSQRNELGNYGVSLEESPDRGSMTLKLMSPCVRSKYTYGMCTTKDASTDTGACLKNGDTFKIEYQVCVFDCKTEEEFFSRFFEIRKTFSNVNTLNHRLPLSVGYSLVEEKYNIRNWESEHGFYTSSQASSGIYRQWQTGWVGGCMSTLPMSILGKTESVSRCEQTLDFVFSSVQSPSGFLYGIFCDGRTYGDGFGNIDDSNIVLMRKNADALYFLAKYLLYLKRSKLSIKPRWLSGFKKLADAFCSFFEKNKMLGQFVDIEAFEVVNGETCSAGIAGAGLCLAQKVLDDDKYLDYARKISEYYYQKYSAKGLTNGGPGEMLQCPDSESAFGILESYVVLYDATQDEKWLKYAVNAANQCSSWCVSYNYDYNKYTQFRERKINTVGSVWANVQNKHSAPGICTLSGASLFNLFRFTGIEGYNELIGEIAHNITQYVSTKENPFRKSYIWHSKNTDAHKRVNIRLAKLLQLLHKNPASKNLTQSIYNQNFNKFGCMDERVNLSDWEGKQNVGEVPGGSCWCEVSLMLTHLEIPSLYIAADKGKAYAYDHLEAEIKNIANNQVTFEIYNPTDYDAMYSIFAEREMGKVNNYEEVYPYLKRISVKSKERRVITTGFVH